MVGALSLGNSVTYNKLSCLWIYTNRTFNLLMFIPNLIRYL